MAKIYLSVLEIRYFIKQTKKALEVRLLKSEGRS